MNRDRHNSKMKESNGVAGKELDQPLVSCVIISYNDAKNLPSAIKSVQQQTLNNVEIIVVDDCSTDNTGEVVEVFVRSDDRIKYLCLDKNSGGCGAPRNNGIRMASAKYVFFLDSDDRLERHALKNLYLTAERDGVDFVAGRMTRFFVDSGAKATWYPELYGNEVRDTHIDQIPDFVKDAAVTNKLYRADFLKENNLFFDETVHYEDLIFSSQMLVTAKSFSIIPEEVYVWYVYPTVERKSITHQRDSLKNVQDRLNAIDYRWKTFKSRSSPAAYDNELLHFLRHHARLYMNDSTGGSDEYVKLVLGLFRPYIDKIPYRIFEKLDAAERVLYAMALSGDQNGLRHVVRYLREGARLGGNITHYAKRSYWLPDKSTNPSKNTKIRKLQDITGDPLLTAPMIVFVFDHSLRMAEVHGSKTVLVGNTDDPLHKLENPQFKFFLYTGIFSKSVEVPVLVNKTDQGYEWRATIDNPSLPIFPGGRRWDAYIQIKQNGITNQSPVFANNVLNDEREVRLGWPLSMYRLFGVKLYLCRSEEGVCAFKHRPKAGLKRFLRGSRFGERSGLRIMKGVLSRVKRIKHVIWQIPRKITRVIAKDVAYLFFRFLPVKRDLIFFESQLGSAAVGSPKAIYDAMLHDDRCGRFSFVWSSRKADGIKNDRTMMVARGRVQYMFALARASVLVDDQTLPRYFRKRKNQIVIQTWHGIPLKHMGLDEPSMKKNPQKLREILRRASLWDALISPGKYFEKTFVKAYSYKGDLIRGGTPRNDILFRSKTKKIDGELDLPSDRKIVLYAPTFREKKGEIERETKLNLNLKRWVEEMGDEYYLLLRPHYLNRINIPKSYGKYMMNVSKIADINQLYLSTDILVTDYSSVMFDFATLRRPMVFYTYDYDDYTGDERGVYFDLRNNAPGDLVYKQSDLHDAIRNASSAVGSKKYEEFVKEFCGEEDGNSSERCVEYILHQRGEI